LAEQQKCPECGSTYLVRDGSTGEVACSGCGLVLSGVEHVPPFMGEERRGAFSMVSAASGRLRLSGFSGESIRVLRMVGRRDGRERTEMQLASDVSAVAWRIGASKKPIEETAMWYGKRLLRRMREKGMRMTVRDIAVVAVWHACKLHGFKVTMKDFEKALNCRSLYKLIVKASAIEPAPGAILKAESYIGVIAARLNGDRKYISAIESYALTLCRIGSKLLEGKDPLCVAATALCVTDELIGGCYGREHITSVLNSGYSPSTARVLKEIARYVPMPPHVQEVALPFIMRRVLEVKAHEDAKNGLAKNEEVKKHENVGNDTG
jgi:transcription initiation factor TFIIIB Brf1 subunit/transcription initiation factor TFIIB